MTTTTTARASASCLCHHAGVALGPVILGSIGGAIVLVSLVLTVFVITPKRYRLDLENAFDGGTNVRGLVRDQGRLTLLGALGSAMTLAAFIWQSASS